MNIFVTGANSFVGSFLKKNLLSKKLHVVSCLRGNKTTTDDVFYIKSLNGSTNWRGAFKGIDCVIHCAARVHLMKDENEDPISAFREVNVHGTMNLAKSAAKAGVKRFVFISSIKVNGESTTARNPYLYSDEPATEDPYGISKAEAEIELLTLGAYTGMEIVIIRPPLVYGPGVKANFAALIKLVSKGLPLPFGLIKSNKRSMVYVENLISLITECTSNPNAVGKVFLVSDNEDLSLAELIKRLSYAFGKKALLLPFPQFLFELLGKYTGKSAVVDRLIGSLQVDIEHTCKTLNWSPPYTVEQGFAETAKHFKN